MWVVRQSLKSQFEKKIFHIHYDDFEGLSPLYNFQHTLLKLKYNDVIKELESKQNLIAFNCNCP